jgi:2-keto-4-pentenoate hydratase/2-oxohepta-3-ene-1,7-dioic acid hydratase in catechol pathway
MKFCSFKDPARRVSYGFLLREDLVIDLQVVTEWIRRRGGSSEAASLPEATDLKSWLKEGRTVLEAAAKLRRRLLEEPDLREKGALPLGSLTLLPPIPNPGKIIAIGLNYRDHAAEQNAPLPAAPLIFAKFTTALIGHGAEIRLPSISQKVDVEAELCVIMLESGRGFGEADARRAIAGYTVGNDVSARDLQFGDKQWVRGKSCDTFAPCGPFLVTEDEVGDPHSLNIELRLSGETRQSSNTRELIFNCYALVSYISQAITLETGDVIYTGTPSGVGVFAKPPRFLKSGDIVEIAIEKIGALRNTVVAD